MSLVIDANAANSLAAGMCVSSRLILAWVRTDGRVVSGGRLQRELGKTKLAPLLMSWSAAGKLKLIPDDEITAEEVRIIALCRSDDEHVLAIVAISNSRVVVTGDQALKDDLKDNQITGQRRKIISHGVNGFSRPQIVRALLRECG